MRLSKFSLRMLLALAVVACAVVVSRTPAVADDMQMTTCPAMAAMKWVSPMSPNNSGNTYTVTLNKHEMTCAQAQSWVKKLSAQHIAGKPQMPSYPPLRGGPTGYSCMGSPDNTGHAYRGHCDKLGGGPFAPSFNWTTP